MKLTVKINKINQTIASLGLSGLLLSGCTHYVKPRPLLQQSKTEITTSLVKIAQEECDRAYLANLPDGQVVVCDERRGSHYRQEWGLPLDQLCDVAVQEKHFPPVIEYLWGDEVIVTLEDYSSFRITLADKNANNLASLLGAYQKISGNSCPTLTPSGHLAEK